MNKGRTRKYPPVDQLSAAERIGMVKDIFATITGKYDFLNHLLSLRRDIAWRRFAVRKMRFFRTGRFLDVAAGTCDLAVETARTFPRVRVTGIDFVNEMLSAGRQKIRSLGLSSRIPLLQGDALALPFPDATFDCAGIAFGIRNIPQKIRAVREITRVVVPGGSVLVLEMTFPRHAFLRRGYDIYLNRLLPRMAAIFSPNPRAYFYLGNSILNFPQPPELARMLASAGLAKVKMYPLTLGIAHLHVGCKPED